MTGEDAAWVEDLMRGDPAAWERFQVEVGPVVRAALRRTLGASAGAADLEQCFQELCLRLCEDGYRRLGTYQGKSRLASWAAIVAIRLAREASSRQRALWAAEHSHPGGLLSEDPLLALLEKEALLRAMDALPARERLVLRLIYWDRATLAEASAVLGIPANTLSPMLTSIRKRLRNLLSK